MALKYFSTANHFMFMAQLLQMYPAIGVQRLPVTHYKDSDFVGVRLKFVVHLCDSMGDHVHTENLMFRLKQNVLRQGDVFARYLKS